MIHTKMMKPECLWDLKASLGEGVVWIESEQSVYFVSIFDKKIYRYHPESQEKQIWDTHKQPTFVLPTTSTYLLCGMEDGLYWFNPVHGQLIRWLEMDEGITNNRLNDGYIDSLGRLWFGTMDRNEQDPKGSLYLLEWDSTGTPVLSKKDSNYVVTNGPLLTNSQRLYHNHSNAQHIYSFTVIDTNILSNKQIFVHLDQGYPDGMALDCKERLWVCLYNGWGINVYDSHGEMVENIPFPCPNVTKIAFGGKDYTTAYVTTARKGMTSEQGKEAPLAGGLFSFKVPVSGQPQYKFKIPEIVKLEHQIF
ncbi:SMP-30/gluconolactonase/LRE family protein [Commensalibacter oyaizuii]|uniref:SMP-30/gluconolactonase/LRE family protein n=1 Tax=Commensalibacter oyaizuii TaxID=3043873 RepID=A0ABT6Q0E9_9PROT|nr:SMP-30/gluconolactonase/LRE family protein [Commensalibacter sp. TBRC 16381]MDI2090570.1 SMP-30/gluconolactonase/LRE family protein [Commensalibacter sp. TBRC 16381]